MIRMAKLISIEDFKKIDIRVGEVLSAEKIDGSDKLLKLRVNFGNEERQVLSGIAAFFPDPSTLVGKRYPFVTNLAPRSMMGLESQAMIMATGDDPSTPLGIKDELFLFETNAAPGSRVR